MQKTTSHQNPQSQVLTLCQRVKSLIKVLCGEYPFYTAQAQVYHLVVDQRPKDLLHGLGDRRKDHDTKSKSIDRNRSDRGSVLPSPPRLFPKKVKNDSNRWNQGFCQNFQEEWNREKTVRTCSEDTHHQKSLTWEKDGKGPAVVTVPKNTQPFHRSAKGP